MAADTKNAAGKISRAQRYKIVGNKAQEFFKICHLRKINRQKTALVSYKSTDFVTDSGVSVNEHIPDEIRIMAAHRIK